MALETLRPNAAGAECNINSEGPGDAACPNHYQNVDEASADDNITYVAQTAEGYVRDLYNLQNHSVGSGTINSVRLYYRVLANSAATRCKGVIRSDSTVTEGSEHIPYNDFGAGWGTYSQTWYTNPADGQPWGSDWSVIDDLQAGVKLEGIYEEGQYTRCTQVYVVVDYTVPIVAPTVTAQAGSSVEDTTATTNGNITDNGGENCDKRGVVYDTSTHADPGDVAPGASGYADYAEDTDSFGTGAFTKAISGLPTGTTIYYRMYAHNSGGYDYSNTEITFLTKPAAPTNVDATDGDHTDKVVVTWMKSTGATGYKVYEGANLLDTLGDVATYDDTAAPAPTITPGTASASDGSSTAHVTLSLAGESANNGTSRTYKVVALNATGDSDDSSTDTGYRGAGALARQWWRSLADNEAAFETISGATTDPYDDTGAPAPTVTPGTASASDGSSTAYVTLSLAGGSANVGAGRYYKCRLTATGATAAYSTSNRGYRGVGALTRQWYRSAGDSDASYSLLGGATTDPYNDTTAPAPTITPGTCTASDGTYNIYTRLSLAGESANVGAGRYYKCYVSATGAASQYSTANRGYRGVGGLTRQWQRSAGDSDASYSNISGATTDPYNDTAAPAPTITKGTVTASDGSYTDKVRLDASGYSTSNGAGRWYRCYLTATGASPQYSTTNRGYRSPGTLNRQWQKSAGDSDASYSNIVGATSDPYDYTGAPAPTITPGNAAASDGAYHEHVALSLSGQSTSNGAGRYYRAQYTASGCTTQYTSGNRGYRGVGSLTYQWQRSSGDSDADYSNISGATTASYNDAGAPVNGDGRYYQCVENATGAAPQTSSSNRGYRQQVVGPFPTFFKPA